MKRTIHKTTSANGQDFYFAVADEVNGIVASVYHKDPSTLGEEAQADAVVQLRVETDSDQTIRVLAHLWDDETDKGELSRHLITLIEGKKENVC